MSPRAGTDSNLVFCVPDGARVVLLRRGDVRLHGMLLEPTPPAAGVGIVHVHGRGGNFYSRPGSSILARYPDPGVAHLAVNLRAHDLAYTDIPDAGGDPVTQREYGVGGAMWERTADSIEDIRIAVEALRHRGCTAVFVAGHSGAALPVALYAADHPGLAGRILLSPLTTGKASLVRWFGDEAGVETAIARARRLVDEGRGHLLIPVDQWFYAISAVTLLERAHESDVAWQQAMESDDSPCLLVWGAAEQRAASWHDAFTNLRIPAKQASPIAGAGHYYVGFDDELVRAVSHFVGGVVNDIRR